MKHILEYNKKDIHEIMNKNLIIYLGDNKIESKEPKEVIKGKIVDYSLASNDPNLPIEVEVICEDNTIRQIDVFDIMRIEEIK